ncbi:MAG: hypothetical protein QXZ70_03895 [Candidatus Bathyarchaeia archaeon]
MPNLNKLKHRTPWWLKICIKLFLSRLPLSYGLWRKLGIFRHGKMLNPVYAQNVFQQHWNLAKPFIPAKDYTILELGPGDSLFTAILGSVAGAKKIWLVDVGKFAQDDVNQYYPLLSQLPHPWSHLTFPDLSSMLSTANAIYLTEGISSLRTIPSSSIDFLFSQAVLEHIYLSEFEATIKELFRIQTSGGIASHCIDLKDHLAYSLNSLRFSHRIWESPWFAKRSGFYTNRLRASQIMQILKNVGYEILYYKFYTWDKLPIKKHLLSAPFNTMPDEELLIREIDILLRKPSCSP